MYGSPKPEFEFEIFVVTAIQTGGVFDAVTTKVVAGLLEFVELLFVTVTVAVVFDPVVNNC